MARLLYILLLLISTGAGLRAAEVEKSAFDAAMRAFQDGFSERAESLFSDFVLTYTNSPRVAQAIVMQARASFQQKRTSDAVALLTTNLFRAGDLADEYHLWLAQIRLEDADFRSAAQEFALLVRNFPNSSRRLEASYGEAFARFKLQDWPTVVELLRNPKGAFQKASLGSENADLVIKGRLLLAEALVERGDFGAASAVVQGLPSRQDELDWRRQYLLCQIELSGGKLPSALEATTNLVTLALKCGQPSLQANSYLVQGEILEQLKRPDDALATYERAQEASMPADKRRQALLATIRLRLAQGQISEAEKKLSEFTLRYKQDAASEVVWLSLGEVKLRQFLQRAPSPDRTATNQAPVPLTNTLQLALGYFDQVVHDYPQSRYLGQALLDRAWCLWLDGKITDSQTAFKAAIEALPLSLPQAVARFKLAETHFAQQDYTNALACYRTLLDLYANQPAVKQTLLDRALYQMLRVGIQMGDLAIAQQAMRQALEWFPSNLYSEGALFLYGQTLNERNTPAQAREVFTQFLSRFPASPLRPEVELAVARSYELEGDWQSATNCYESWVAHHPNLPITPRGQFSRAVAIALSGQDTNAFILFTNFLVLYPTNALGARAQDWVGDYFFRRGEFKAAEICYQLLFQNTNWPVSELNFQALLKAGRAAFLNQNPKDATNYFTELINLKDPRGPDATRAQAFFAYGDTLVNMPIPAATNAILRFAEAAVVFGKIPQLYPNDRLVFRAWGRIGDCQLQLATQDPRRCTNAFEAYLKAAGSAADVSTRSEAEVGLGNVLLAQSRLGATNDAVLARDALGHYLNVIHERNLREGEQPDLFWLKVAGIAALKVIEDQQQWRQCYLLCERLLVRLPSLKATLEKKRAFAREQMELGRN